MVCHLEKQQSWKGYCLVTVDYGTLLLVCWTVVLDDADGLGDKSRIRKGRIFWSCFFSSSTFLPGCCQLFQRYSKLIAKTSSHLHHFKSTRTYQSPSSFSSKTTSSFVGSISGSNLYRGSIEVGILNRVRSINILPPRPIRFLNWGAWSSFGENELKKQHGKSSGKGW